MQKRLVIPLLALFFLCFGFAGGGLVLLYIVVPLADRLQAANWSQRGIDHLLSVFVYGWWVVVGAATYAYYRLTFKPTPRRRAVFAVPAVALLAAAAMFYVFLHTNLVMIAAKTGITTSDPAGRFTFGPYPDLQRMQALKAQGYTAVISLLHPSLPFEAVLIEEEEEDGQKAGLKVYSVPMLPWISDNREALAEIKRLAELRGQKYYVHCYLGRDRTELVHRLVLASAGVKSAGGVPEKLERGLLFSYKGGRILAGPYPTDDEWIGVVFHHGVKEIVSVLDPAVPDNQPWIDKLGKVAKDNEVKLTLHPLQATTPNENAVQELAAYLQASDHNVYVTGMLDGNWLWALDTAMGGGGSSVREALARDNFERGPILKAAQGRYFGPLPTVEELSSLREAGVRDVISLLDTSDPANVSWQQEEDAWGRLYGFRILHFPLNPDHPDPAQVQNVVNFLRDDHGPVYVHGFGAGASVQAVFEATKASLLAASGAGGPAKAK